MLTDKQAANMLGATGIAIGAAELLAPETLTKALGLNRHNYLLPTMGAREIASGIGILASSDPAPGLWSRVAGDVVDVALLGSAFVVSKRRGAVAVATALVLGITVLDILVARKVQAKRP